MLLIILLNTKIIVILSGLNFKLKKTELRNKIKVNVNIENKVDFAVSQGQYQAIILLIQQNFPEIQCAVLDLFVLPVPKFVHLKV